MVLEKRITLSAEYLPGLENTIVDKESHLGRMETSPRSFQPSVGTMSGEPLPQG